MTKSNDSMSQAERDFGYASGAVVEAIAYERAKPSGRMPVCEAVLSASGVDNELPAIAVDLLTKVGRGETLVGSERLAFASLAVNRAGDYARLIVARVA